MFKFTINFQAEPPQHLFLRRWILLHPTVMASLLDSQVEQRTHPSTHQWL